MIKNFLVSIILLFAIGMSAQSGTPSPYSFYGIGEVTFRGAAENRFMGGTSVFPDSIHVNFQNPASYAGLKLTALTLGATHNRTKFKTDTDSEKATRSTLDYLALGLPMGKFGAGFGIMPYSSVGYSLKTDPLPTDVSADNVIRSRYNGSGGLNKAFFALAYQLSSKLQIGADFNFNFGQIKTTSTEYRSDVQYGSRERNTSKMAGASVNLGLMFQSKLKKKLDVFASLVFTPQTTLGITVERNLATIIYAPGESEIVIDELDVDNDHLTIKMPSKIAFGGGIGVARKWMVGTELTFQQVADYSKLYEDLGNVSFESTQRYSIGGYYIPNYNSFRSYLSKVTYRGGMRYETTGLVINGKSIEDKAVTFGFGFPLGGTFSNINIGMEIGRRGTKAVGLVEENYKNFTLSLSLNDRWFVKRKID